jgi:hypothetical protein
MILPVARSAAMGELQQAAVRLLIFYFFLAFWMFVC